MVHSIGIQIKLVFSEHLCEQTWLGNRKWEHHIQTLLSLARSQLTNIGSWRRLCEEGDKEVVRRVNFSIQRKCCEYSQLLNSAQRKSPSTGQHSYNVNILPTLSVFMLKLKKNALGMHILCSMSFVHNWWPKSMKHSIRTDANANCIALDSCNCHFCTSGKRLSSLIYTPVFVQLQMGVNNKKECRWLEGGQNFRKIQDFVSPSVITFHIACLSQSWQLAWWNTAMNNLTHIGSEGAWAEGKG